MINKQTKLKDSVTINQLSFVLALVVVVFTCSEYSFNKRDKQLKLDGISISAEIIDAYASSGSNRIEYEYSWKGKSYKKSDDAPGHLNSCCKHKKCIGDTIRILMSKSDPKNSKIKD